MTSIYKNASSEGAPENKKNRWEIILGEDRYLKCRQDLSGDTDGDTKSVKVYKICTGDDCMPGSSATFFDEIYMGRVEINTNGGNKRRSLYFQAEDGIRDVERSRGLGDVYKRQSFAAARIIFKRILFYIICKLSNIFRTI